MCGFIAQLVEHRTGIAEVMGSNPVEALIFFRLLLSNCLNWKIYCDDHTSLLYNKQLLDEAFVISRIIKVEVMVISPSRRLRLITLTETSHVFASSLMASNTKHANLTCLPLEVMYRGHTWHDYPWPWVSLTYNTISAVRTSWALILKIHCTLSANQKRVKELNV